MNILQLGKHEERERERPPPLHVALNSRRLNIIGPALSSTAEVGRVFTFFEFTQHQVRIICSRMTIP